MASSSGSISRLDRLIGLLDSGSTTAIRASAARQLGQIAERSSNTALSTAADHDDAASSTSAPTTAWSEGVLLLAKIVPLLRKKEWETRIAAANAIGAVCDALPLWVPQNSPKPNDSKASQYPLPSPSPLDSFDLARLLASGHRLLSSAGKEFDALARRANARERLEHAKSSMRSLGLSVGGIGDVDLGMDVEAELKAGDDGASDTSKDLSSDRHSKPKAAQAITSSAPALPDFSATSSLSARERNALKRKLKAAGGGSNGDADSSGPRKRPNLSATPSSAEMPTAAALPANSSIDPSASSADAFALLNEDPLGWPFEPVCAVLAADLFNPAWEVRHGAALGLRELMRSQGSGAGLSSSSSSSVKEEDDSGGLDQLAQHAAFLEDVAVRLLSVCALDRLNDFVLDQVMAPVRETCAQALASVLLNTPSDSEKTEQSRAAQMPLGSVQKVHKALVQMILQEQPGDKQNGKGNRSTFRRKRGNPGYAWEVRHAGFLGLKYEVSARLDLLFDDEEAPAGGSSGVKVEDTSYELGTQRPNAYFFEVIELTVLGLRDEDDDIRSAAATTLIALAPLLGGANPKSQLPTNVILRVLDTLWASLAEAEGDDLGSSMASIMNLLAKLMEYDQIQALVASGSDLAEKIATLFPYFRHTITGVRVSVLRALKVFLRMGIASSSCSGQRWLDASLLRLLFQNLILEERRDVRDASMEAWSTAMEAVREMQSAGARQVGSEMVSDLLEPHVPDFFRLIMTPIGSPVDTSLLFRPARRTSRNANGHGRHDVDKGMLTQDLALVGVDTVMHNRLGAATALGHIIRQWPSQRHELIGTLVSRYLNSSSALHKCLASSIIQEWVKDYAYSDRLPPLGSRLADELIAIIEAPAPPTYAEMEVALTRLLRECQGLYWSFHTEARVARDKIPTLPTHVDALGQRADAFTIETARHAVGPGFDALMKQVGSKSKKVHADSLEERRRNVIASLGFYQVRKERSDVQVFASVASALIALRTMPAKLNPVIRSIMNSVKFEENADLQAASARSVARFIKLCGDMERDGRPGNNPSDKVVKNLCAFVCQDTTRTAVFSDTINVREGILSLDAEIAAANVKAGPGRPSAGSAAAVEANDTEEVRQGKLIRRGAERALCELATLFDARLLDQVPALRSAIWDSIQAAAPSGSSSTSNGLPTQESSSELDRLISTDSGMGQSIIDACTVIEAVVLHLHASLHPGFTALLSQIRLVLQSTFAAVRSAAARCYGSILDIVTEQGMLELVTKVVPLLGDAENVYRRQGAMELVLDVVRRLDTKLLPYVIFFIVPVLGRMTDSDDKVRLAATNAFASLVKMIPLEAGLPDPAGFPADMLARRQEERKFLDQLLNGKVEEYKLPVKINAKLRTYQREGISWMAFLAKFKLHGILCDDMGLGKTLQSITILSCDHFERAQAYKQHKTPEMKHLPSLVVCPSTLTGHWYHEILQYSTNLRPVLYVGQPQERARVQKQLAHHDIVITSYEIVRNDVNILGACNWNYCILDEGHVIKSGKTKTSKAVKSLKANHRLILSGTPIQNSVLELWNLFDFLMPGFLGTERSFQEKYGKPILASREGKGTAKEQEAATFALEALHKQVLPFLLRRMKEDVLDDLPPKIIQDIECDLGEIQQALYDDFTSSQDRVELEGAFEDDNKARPSNGQDEQNASSAPAKQHAFQSLQYLRKLVNHPILVLDKSNPRHAKIFKRVEGSESGPGRGLRDIAHAPKLQVLKQLLNDCGIGLGANLNGTGKPGSISAATEGDLLSEAAGGAAVSQHRVLIFCQLKQMLDIIEKDLFGAHMPSVTYMRLDGSVAAEKRHGIVRTFNSDPSIDVLLLTTSVGGLGLTLTGADTVIFVEHDWNPMKDVQAMDRAHRLGQKKVVNVYRLITRNTLEQKIMGYQRFKLHIANSVITQDNATMSSMDTDGILDLFEPSSGPKQNPNDAQGSGQKKISQKQLLEQLQNMPDNEEDEYRQMTSWKPT
ncbi:TATA-binding protein-associated factor mot1 [Tilletia horrida]|uniref:TATA-binding protein-associated factor mot1 n=1 Tax=Tilletia horrida TaxID=155126 RepID=A0AAN6JPU5_9BASI|nr:TATA-binding protein-associated factor mot1 [Tilletia horrida]KAK0553753.1 TATA-binding protein-associated factor mot1 [Tilletia horrida]KAK0562401.1 TATA-binding protein-associated factor mot1 [Tilletia horrida]